jgi:putative copper export protein
MKDSDHIIGDLLKKHMQEIEDDSFTERIVRMHLSKQKKPVYKPFRNFGLLIIGFSSVFISAGLILSLLTKTVLIKNFIFTAQYGLILLLVSLIFLISVWIENAIAPKSRGGN